MEEVTNCFIIQIPEGLKKTVTYQTGYVVYMHAGY
jgi:hypothetical protein